MNALESLPAEDKAEFLNTLEEMQLTDGLRMYNRTVAHCFQDCVKSFHSKKLDTKELSCLNNCAEKFLKHSQRTGVRFAEAQQDMANVN